MRHPCDVIDCDCANIEAGLLSGAWRTDCRGCRGRLREACVRAYPPLSRAMVAGGYCRGCSVYGPNPYPEPARPPEPSTERTPAVRPMALSCALNQRRASATIDGLEFSGCVDATGRRQGLWVARDEARGRLIEILFVNGAERSRATHPSG